MEKQGYRVQFNLASKLQFTTEDEQWVAESHSLKGDFFKAVYEVVEVKPKPQCHP